MSNDKGISFEKCKKNDVDLPENLKQKVIDFCILTTLTYECQKNKKLQRLATY